MSYWNKNVRIIEINTHLNIIQEWNEIGEPNATFIIRKLRWMSFF